VALSESGWQDTELALPEGNWVDRLTGATHCGVVAVSQLFTGYPVALLERTDG
jgi:(1->4)-alpha-D-glucan 1-alpha-D-glucosylmutase